MMKRLLLLAVTLIVCSAKVFALGDNIDSLKQKLDLAQNDSLKAYLYTQLASEYMKYDADMGKKHGRLYQNEALKYTLLAVHAYSRFNDTLNLRQSFDRLTYIYHLQGKNSEAKWFVLQSNTLSRAKNDIPNIIESLLMLASIQTDIEDYKLAHQNLAEALDWATKYHYQKEEAEVQQGFVAFYERQKEYDKADEAQKLHDSIADNIKKDEEARLMTKLKQQTDSIDKKKGSLSNNSSSDSSAFKTNYAKRIASL